MHGTPPATRARSNSAPAILKPARPCYDKFVQLCEANNVDLTAMVEVAQYLAGLEDQVKRDRSNSWDRAIHTYRSQIGNTNDPARKRLLRVLREMFFFLEQRFPQPLNPIPDEVLVILSQPVCSLLNGWARYSCNNAVTYMAKYGNQALLYLVYNRGAYVDAPEYSATQTNLLMSGKGFNPMAKDDDDYNCFTDKQLKNAHDGLVAARAGECISFSLAALHVVVGACKAGQLPQVHRVELVSMGGGGSGHTFIVINRDAAGGYGTLTGKLQKHRTLPKNADWTGDFIILDPWMGAMGHAVFYGSRTDYLGGDFVCDYFWKRD